MKTFKIAALALCLHVSFAHTYDQPSDHVTLSCTPAVITATFVTALSGIMIAGLYISRNNPPTTSQRACRAGLAGAYMFLHH